MTDIIERTAEVIVSPEASSVPVSILTGVELTPPSGDSHLLIFMEVDDGKDQMTLPVTLLSSEDGIMFNRYYPSFFVDSEKEGSISQEDIAEFLEYEKRSGLPRVLAAFAWFELSKEESEKYILPEGDDRKASFKVISGFGGSEKSTICTYLGLKHNIQVINLDLYAKNGTTATDYIVNARKWGLSSESTFLEVEQAIRMHRQTLQNDEKRPAGSEITLIKSVLKEILIEIYLNGDRPDCIVDTPGFIFPDDVNSDLGKEQREIHPVLDLMNLLSSETHYLIQDVAKNMTSRQILEMADRIERVFKLKQSVLVNN